MNEILHYLDLSARFSKARSETYHNIYLKSQYNLIKRILCEKDYLVSTFYFPSEIVALFDLPVMYIERVSGFAAANKLIKDINIKRLSVGMPACGCTYQLAFESLIEDGHIPIPSGYMALSFACDDAYIYCETSAIRYDKPFYFIDIPALDEDGKIEYVGKQLEKLFIMLCEKYSLVNSIENIVNISNATLKLKLQIDDLRMKYPGILDSIDSLKLFPAYNDLGQKHTFDIFNELLNTLMARIDDYSPVDGARILWLGVLPLYNNSVLTSIEKRYQCRIVYEELFDYGSCIISADNFFNDLARRIFSSIFFSVDRRAASILKIVDAMCIDGIICFSQRNCRFLPPMLPCLRKRLESKEIPFIAIQGDAIDPSNSESSRLWDVLDDFFGIVNRGRNQCILTLR